MKKSGRRILSKLYIAAVLLFLFLPIAVVVLYSFNASATMSSARFDGFTWNWYRELLNNRPMIQSLKNSLVIALWSVVIAVLVGTPAAVVTAKHSFRGKGAFESLTFLPLMLPEIILGIAFLTYYSTVGIPFGMLSMILAHATFCIPYVVNMVKTRLAGFDKSLEEASRDLGATGTQAFVSVLLPAIAPAVVSAAMLGFVMSLDDVVISFFTAGPTSNTLPLLIYSQLKLRPSPMINALCTLMIVVVFAAVGAMRLIPRLRNIHPIAWLKHRRDKGSHTTILSTEKRELL